MKKLLQLWRICSVAVFLAAMLILSVGAEATTIATFADPFQIAPIIPLFTVNLLTGTIAGSWTDSKTGLTLQIPYSGNNYPDAFFTMTDVIYTGSIYGGVTGGGTVKFFADGQSTSEMPLIQIYFEAGFVSPHGLGGMDEFFANGVVITGSEIDTTLSDESFSFSFTNQKAMSGGWSSGFTATSAFTSSAIPEPATVAILSIGALSLIRRKKH